MAKMIPNVVPDADGQSTAEQWTYEELRRQLPDEYIVFHGVQFLQSGSGSRNRDREIDFLVIHPDRAGVVIEVKGGGITYDPEYDVWNSIDRHGNQHQITDPVRQARSNMYDLLDELANNSRTRPFSYTFNWQVMLPELAGVRNDMGIRAPAEAVIDSTDLFHLREAIERAARPLAPDKRLSTAAVRALVEAITPSVDATPNGLGYHLLTSERKLIELTREQALVLDFLEHQTRAGIAGCCGSGKTMLALEKAKRLAASGQRVLLTCFNANLGYWLQEQLQREDPIIQEQIVCCHYHELVRNICAEAGVEIPPEPEDRDAVSAYYNEMFPDCLDRAIQQLPLERRFDAVIADEGQDFNELWWTTLDSILKDPQHGTFYIFYDNNQRIYSKPGAMPVPEHPFPLNRNCRNTDEIHRLVRPYYRGDASFQHGGVRGLPPELVEVNSADGIAELRRVLHRLTSVERVPEHDITVLSPVRESGGSALLDGVKIGNVTLRRTADIPDKGEIRLSTIHSFKGLESPIVILTELDRLARRSPEAMQSLLYVGLSRARSHLVVIGDLPEAEPVNVEE